MRARSAARRARSAERRAEARRRAERRRRVAAASRRAAAAAPRYPRLVVPAVAPGAVTARGDDPATPRAALAATGAILLALAGAGAVVVTRASREAQP
jgi:hypothetical protein